MGATVLVVLLGGSPRVAAQSGALAIRAEVEARQAELDAAVASGELELRTAPPGEGTAPLPDRLAALGAGFRRRSNESVL